MAIDEKDASGPSIESSVHALEGVDFQAVFESAPDACVIVDAEGRIVLVNEETERLFGYDRDELLGRPVECLVPADRRSDHRTQRRAYAEDPAKRPMGIGRELFALRKDGSSIPVEIGLGPVGAHGARFTLAVIRDITLRSRLRAFGSGLLQGAEEERQRIARELHDDTAQSLAALVLRLQMARRSDDPEVRERLLKELHEEIHHTSAGVRRILRGLRPPLLEESGLLAALRAHAKSALADARVGISFHASDVEHLLAHEAKLALYRIVQEAISNVLRHAGASRIDITLEPDPAETRVTLRVEDDGTGFDATDFESSGGRGLGLVGIMERASILGGSAHVESRPGEGTRISVEVPASEPLEE